MGGRTTALAAHVCGHPRPSTVTWLPPHHRPRATPLRPGVTIGRLHAHNLTVRQLRERKLRGSGERARERLIPIFPSPQAGEISECHFSVLTIVGVKASDAGGWVVVAASQKAAHAALIRLNVTAAAHSVAASSSSTDRHSLAGLLVLLLALLAPLWPSTPWP